MPRLLASISITRLLALIALMGVGCGGMPAKNAAPPVAPTTRGAPTSATRGVSTGDEIGSFAKGTDTATSHSVNVSGGLDERVIQRAMAKHQSPIRACYERELRKNSNLSGKVVVRWVVDLTGVVQGAQVIRSTLNNSKVSECVVQRINQIRFPKPKGGGQVTITYPFTFAVD